jgi:hypothetical protein
VTDDDAKTDIYQTHVSMTVRQPIFVNAEYNKETPGFPYLWSILCSFTIAVIILLGSIPMGAGA